MMTVPKTEQSSMIYFCLFAVSGFLNRPGETERIRKIEKTKITHCWAQKQKRNRKIKN